MVFSNPQVFNYTQKLDGTSNAMRNLAIVFLVAVSVDGVSMLLNDVSSKFVLTLVHKNSS